MLDHDPISGTPPRLIFRHTIGTRADLVFARPVASAPVSVGRDKQAMDDMFGTRRSTIC